MEQDNRNAKINAEPVNKQLDELEARNASNEKNKKGSTNEIQPFATNDELTQ